MKEKARVISKNGKRIIAVFSRPDGCFVLREFSLRFDAEEEVEYQIEVFSNLSGLYGTLDEALREAKSIIASEV